MDEINKAIYSLVDCSLAEDQNGARLRTHTGGITEVIFNNSSFVSSSLTRGDYEDMYTLFREERAYNILMPDGAMIQLMYEFRNDILQKHRLAFLPSPSLEKFQNDPDLYLGEEVYADVIEHGIVTFPLRFDFDGDPLHHVICHHPCSHLTLGQYKHCRIPVSSPLTPLLFLDFIIRSFYNTAFQKYSTKLPSSKSRFASTIHVEEEKILYLNLPA